MTHRSYSVVVVPDQWDGTLEELAAAMLPITRRAANQVLPLLARGPMTLEADLSVDEAGLLQARLNKLGVPARVLDNDEKVVSDSAHEGASRPAGALKKKAKPKVSEESDVGIRLPRPKSGGASEKPDATDSARASDKESGAESDSPAKSKWASLFPDIDADEADAAAPPKKADTAPPPKKVRSLDELAGDSEATFGAESAAKESSDAPKQQAEPKPRPPVQSPSPGPRGSESKAGRSGRSSGGFDASRMNQALHSEDAGKPPFAPEGFDDSIEHIPALAALLSLIAPGAGQVYNGQKEDARDYGIRAALVLPWYQSVRQAGDYAEKIRTYWAPRPPAGALVDALKYLAVFWIVFGSLVAGLGWLGTTLYDVAKQPDAPKITEADIRSALDQARTDVHMARIEGLDGVASHLDQRDSQHERFTMSKKERAERLYRRGVVFCRDGKYATCESTMKRVTSLSPELRRYAFRLQTWASEQRTSGDSDQPMPDVGNFDSIEEYERRQMEGVDQDDGGSQKDDSASDDPEEGDPEEGGPEEGGPEEGGAAEESADGERPDAREDDSEQSEAPNPP